jgi:hypothetical protein
VGSLERRLERLEGRTGISPEEEAKRQHTDKRRAEIRAELEAFEARRRNMSEAEEKAWRESEEFQTEKRALEAAIERRRTGRSARA